MLIRSIGWVVFVALLSACSEPSAPPKAEATPAGPSTPTSRVTLEFAGSTSCAECHEEAYLAWQESHHRNAMQPATSDTVLGDFDNASLEHFGEVTTFTREEGSFLIEAVDAQGQRLPRPVTHVFGVQPLQQYLLEFPGGRYQIPTLAWDARPKSEGGQRWFHLYPDDPLPPGDPLHWTGPYQNWNSQCAECHSTGLAKNYSHDQDRYDTRWAEVSVGCEACHGRGSRHLAWARDPEGSGQPYAKNRGLELILDPEHSWVMNPQTGIAVRQPALKRHRQAEACGRCHSRRSTQTDDYSFGRPLMDSHRPALIEDGLYFADGQIRDEVYVYGSFLQSRMYQAGVECSDCHEPHSNLLLAEGDQVCARCHLPKRFSTPEHHHHPTESVACVDCHMPERLYMVIDPRRDHSIRVPRPDLTDSLGVPNACNGCHQDQDAAWAAGAIANWYPEERQNQAHFGHALSAAWSGASYGPARAVALAADTDHPAIIRASAILALRGQVAGSLELEAIQTALGDSNSLLRFAALRALVDLPPRIAIPLAIPLLYDRERAVRIEAARVAAPADGQLPDNQQKRFNRVANELLVAEQFNFDRDFGHLNTGNFQLARGQAEKAVQAFQAGLRDFPDSVALTVNLADALRVLKDDAASVTVLLDARAAHPDSAEVRKALGLALVRVGRYEDAVTELRELVRLQPDVGRSGVLLVLALERTGSLQEAHRLLDALKSRHLDDPMVQSVRIGEAE